MSMVDEFEAQKERAKEELLNLARQGIDFQKAVASPFAQAVFRAADIEAEEARRSLAYVSPKDTDEIMRLQLIARRGDDMREWLKAIIEIGLNAQLQIEEPEAPPD